MELQGQQQIPAPRHVVWAALNDPAILAQCVDGCEAFEAQSDDRWRVTVRASVGPVKARFTGSLTVSDRVPLQRYHLHGEGEGGVAGFGRMDADVMLEDADGGTLLRYVADASVGGKLAQIGSRLVNSVAAKMADAFFVQFREAVAHGVRTVHAEASAVDPAATEPGTPATADVAGANVVLVVNGLRVERQVDDRTLLVELLRRDLRLTGTHVGCDTSQCGACTVRLDGRAVKSCTVLAVQASGGEVVTVEGMAGKDGLHPLQQAFVACHGLQCGFCTPGMVMALDGLLRSGAAVDDASICTALEGNICRCTGYVNIIAAARHAARALGLEQGAAGHATVP
jgi:carbon-monoxide dehydrogenase small subunit